MAAVTLLAGLAVGYAVGHGQGRGTAAAPGKPAAPAGQAPGAVGSETIAAVAPSASTGFSGPALTQNPGTCSVQAGRNLELGIPVTNRSGQTVLLESARPVPLVSGILKVLSWRWDPCGFDHDGIVPDTVTLGFGDGRQDGEHQLGYTIAGDIAAEVDHMQSDAAVLQVPEDVQRVE